ncbi:conserved hypothetical protein [Ricinus communis]|uniref:SAP domain-containing protein n=2 Tax=Ricinus communis TaxID=3988 RepID=B9S8J5_RICCO|nr:conserved hypothetical protein [Ricinus communis]
MTDRNRKRMIICVSSSEEEEEEEGGGGGSENNDDDDSEYEEISEDASDFSEDGPESDSVDEENEEALCRRVICFLNEGRDLEALSLKEYKAYLRKHGLRLAGTKAVCMERIKNHSRIKDGNGESLYPRSSFVFNCTGDVCKGDVVLFTQKVYEKFDKVTRRGNLLGKRTVAGRVVKESYGSAKQQHTFTVEVLWSKGVKKLHPLFPLLVKGRNLYKLKTFRQPWNNEAERPKVLAEKHKRGTAARLVRAMKKSKKEVSATGRRSGGAKRQKCSRHLILSQTIKMDETGNRQHGSGHKKDTSRQYAQVFNHNKKVPPARQLNSKRNIRSDVGSKPTRRHLKRGRLNEGADPARHAFAYIRQSPCQSSRIAFHDRTVPFHFSGHDMGSTSTLTMMPPLGPYVNTVGLPVSPYQWVNHRNETRHDHSNPSYNIG